MDRIAEEFDRHAASYQAAVETSISFSGHKHDFFTRAKAEVLLELAGGLGATQDLTVLDVGCGVGETDRLVAGHFGSLHGTDVSARSLEIAEERNPSVAYRLSRGIELPYESASFDLAFSICVLHHVPVPQRRSFAHELVRVVRPGGGVVVMEHNPLNPLTRLAVMRCPFDEEAVLLGRRTTEQLLIAAGISRARSRFILFFPSERRAVRRLERRLARVPAGAQYVTWARR